MLRSLLTGIAVAGLGLAGSITAVSAQTSESDVAIDSEATAEGDAEIEADADLSADTPAIGTRFGFRSPSGRGGCGEFFYWNGIACVDARLKSNDPPR